MRQIIQNMSSGETGLVDVPCPEVGRGSVLIASSVSLISAGTERMLVNFSKASLFEKARQQPEKVKMVLHKVQTDGLFATMAAVKTKLDQPLPLGYSNVGVVIDVGADVTEFACGDRVVSNGGHAEIVGIPKNLCAKIPDSVTDISASFTVLGAIALQGIRLANPTLGERFVVFGLGLIGLLTVQLLRANGCRVLGIDSDPKRLLLAQSFGAEVVDFTKEDSVRAGLMFSGSAGGVDGVLVTASTSSNELMHQAAQMSRKRGRIVLVGVAGLDLKREDFYEKELTFQVSCSYGPGRYDKVYEQKGGDYPLGFVRWTEKRNFEAVLDMLADRRMEVESMVSNVFDLNQAIEAYEVLTRDPDSLGILLKYPASTEYLSGKEPSRIVELAAAEKMSQSSNKVVCGFVGAGNYASRILLPALGKTAASLHTIVSNGGVNGYYYGKQAGFKFAATDVDGVFGSTEINTIIIATRHDSHCDLVIKGLHAGKDIFVEKPLALTSEEVESIEQAYGSINQSQPVRLMVGFNRRFAPHTIKMKSLLEGRREPKCFVVTVNAGVIPPEHWTQDLKVGGGRIIGEACHFIDLLRHLAGSSIVSVQARRIENASGIEVVEDKATITLGFADGSFGTIMYLANGHSSFPKERVEVFVGGAILVLDNFVKLKGYGWKGFSVSRLWRQDKGQKSCVKAFVDSITNNRGSPIPFDELIEVARWSVRTAELLRSQS